MFERIKDSLFVLTASKEDKQAEIEAEHKILRHWPNDTLVQAYRFPEERAKDLFIQGIRKNKAGGKRARTYPFSRHLAQTVFGG